MKHLIDQARHSDYEERHAPASQAASSYFIFDEEVRELLRLVQSHPSRPFLECGFQVAECAAAALNSSLFCAVRMVPGRARLPGLPRLPTRPIQGLGWGMCEEQWGTQAYPAVSCP